VDPQRALIKQGGRNFQFYPAMGEESLKRKAESVSETDNEVESSKIPEKVFIKITQTFRCQWFI
jgi:hypothetical protein